MMFSHSQVRVLSILTVYFALSQANWLDTNLFNHKRQDDSLSGLLSAITSGLGGDSTTTSPSSAIPSTTSPVSTSTTPTTESSPSNTPTPSSTPSSIPSSTPVTTTPTTSTPMSSTPTSESSSSEPTTSSRSTSTSESVSLSTSLSESASVHVTTRVIVTTSDGSVISSTQVSSSTSTSTSTSVATLGADSSNASKGMSSGTKKTIIGVCVGIGGAIVLGALAFVFLRLRKNRKNREEDDGLMGYRADATHEKTTSGAGGAAAGNPFQSTLEGYHAPPRNAGASTNF